MSTTAVLLLVAMGLAMVNAQMNATTAQNAFWLTVNVTYKYETPPSLTTYSWTNKTCIPRSLGSGAALELIQLLPSPTVVWLAGGLDPIDQETWEQYDTLPGDPKWAKIDDGHSTTFLDSCYYASPNPEPDCDPYTDCFKYMSTPPAQGYLNYTWLMLNAIACNGSGGNQIYPLNANWTGTMTTPPPGYLSYSDPWGGWYVLNTFNGDYINATDSILPPGFSLVEYTFPDDQHLLVNPVGDDCLLVVMRDANNNGYFQAVYGDETMWSVTNNTNCTDPVVDIPTSPLPVYELIPSDEVSSSST